jgi:hypothetical protein
MNLADTTITGINKTIAETGTNSGTSTASSKITKGMLFTDAAKLAGVTVTYDSATNKVKVGTTSIDPSSVWGTVLNSNNKLIVDDVTKVKNLLQWNGGKVSTLHTGGIVGNETPSNITQLVNKLFNLKPNEQMVKALKNELMIPQQNMPNFVSNIKNLVSSIQPQVAMAGAGNVVYNLNLNIESLSGDKRGADYLFSEITKGIKKRGK